MNCCKQNKTSSLHLHCDKEELYLTNFLKSGLEQGQTAQAKEETRRAMDNAGKTFRGPAEVLWPDEPSEQSRPEISWQVNPQNCGNLCQPSIKSTLNLNVQACSIYFDNRIFLPTCFLKLSSTFSSTRLTTVRFQRTGAHSNISECEAHGLFHLMNA